MKINFTISAIAIAFITGLFMSCSLNPAVEDPEPIVVNFPDPNFEALIREELEIPERDITNHDMWKIKVIMGVGKNISDITGIEYCSGLQLLKIRENNISDLGPLKDLVLINYLDLQHNQIVDIKPLVENTGIGLGDDIIYIYGNPLSNESILQYKPQLQVRGVKFYSNAELSGPGEINFVDDNFEAIIRVHLNKPTGPILTTDVESITNIWARNSSISNIYGIEYCTNLDTLDIGENQIIDLIPLSDLTQLTVLSVGNNKITDLEPLGGLHRLTYLLLNNNAIDDIISLNNLLNLEYLNLNNTLVENFEAIENIDSLKVLELINLYQFDFSDIKNISNLQTLFLSNTSVTNLDPIANITSLQNLIMTNCDLANIDSLANLNKLRKLFLNDNNIIDIASLTELYELYELNLGNNNISDILPLINNWGISGANDYVLLYNNPLSETSLNTYIPQLEDRGVHVIY